MALVNGSTSPRQLTRRRIQVHYQVNTSNTTFIKMHRVLKALNIRNNKFHLKLYDPSLKNINPRDPNLSREVKARVVKEVSRNFWYFIREVVRIPAPGSNGVKYTLHRGNLAMNYLLVNNLKCILELPRQNFKTTSAAAWYAWLWGFGTMSSEFMFINHKHSYSKANLEEVREILDTIPSYLKNWITYSSGGKAKKEPGNKESMQNPRNKNRIVTKPSARSPEKAREIGRGCTQPHQWYDEMWFIKHNKEIYDAATPANTQASLSAEENGKPFGILVTSTPGVLNTKEGQYGKDIIDKSLHFHDRMYDWTRDKIKLAMKKTAKTSFLYVKYSYKQLGRSEQWFNDVCQEMNFDYSVIRREFLLEWAKISGKSPFEEHDLEIIEGLTKEPRTSIILADYFEMKLYKDIYSEKGPILIGVDVSGGYSRDSTAIVLVSSVTTEIIGVMNHNRISTSDLGKILKELVMVHIPNSVIVPERNSYGEAVISDLLDSPARRCVYYQESKQEMREKRKNGIKYDSPTSRFDFGVYTNSKTRPMMMELLREYVNFHKDKFVSNIIAQELNGLEYSKRHRIEHGPNTHDDTVMAYLMALYVYHYGTNVRSFGIERRELKKDSEQAALIREKFSLKNKSRIPVYQQIREEVYGLDESVIDLTANTKSMASLYRDHDKEIHDGLDALDREIAMQNGVTDRLNNDRNFERREFSNDFFRNLNGNGDLSKVISENGVVRDRW